MPAVADEQWIDAGGPWSEGASCYVPEGYQGPCAMSYSSGAGTHWAIFPSREVAVAAAIGACRRDVGGYTAVSVYAVGAAEAGAKRYDEATDWLFEGEILEDQLPASEGVRNIVRNAMRELARRMAAAPKELALVEWRDLERLLLEVFETLGYRATLTRPAKDGGYDIRLEDDGGVYFVEVKHWSKRSKVGRGIINRFAEIVIANGGEGLLLSTSGFTSDVIKGRLELSEYPVALGDELKIISLCRLYVKAETGIWVREHSLRDILFEGEL
jgi:hypothetical protein